MAREGGAAHPMRFTRVLVVADIEGSSGCWSRRASAFMTPEWRRACVEMTRDVDALVRSLFGAGAAEVRVVDFHRTGHNLLPERIDPRARVLSGYRRGPVPGMGDPAGAEAALFVGMHAASGTPGFLAHTLTSRLALVEVNGRLLAEIALFAASLAPFGVRPVFVSGCPAACAQAEALIPGIRIFPLSKSGGPGALDAAAWRRGLAEAAALSLENRAVHPWDFQGPFRTVVTLRDGDAAARALAARWGIEVHGRRLFFTAADAHQLFLTLIRLCYLTPFVERTLPVGLFLYRLIGRAGLAWVRHGLRRETPGRSRPDDPPR